ACPRGARPPADGWPPTASRAAGWATSTSDRAATAGSPTSSPPASTPRVNDRGNRMRLPVGRFKYDLAMLAELSALRPVPYRITLDGGEVREGEATLGADVYGPSSSCGMRVCPGATLTTGETARQSVAGSGVPLMHS